MPLTRAALHRLIGPGLLALVIDFFHALVSNALVLWYRFNPFAFVKIPPIQPSPDFSNLRIALVKQDIYSNLYCIGPDETVAETVLSSLKHTGPLGLFTRSSCRFFIVPVESAPECAIWEEKVDHCRQGTRQLFYDIRDLIYENGTRGHTRNQGAFSRPCAYVDWGQFDIVISVDVSIPAHITKAFKDVLWCYYISEPCMPAYSRSQDKPIDGYHVFLNQRFSQPPFRSPKSHEINFPFALQHANNIFSATGLVAPTLRSGVFIEGHTARVLTNDQLEQLAEFGPVRTAEGSTEAVLSSLIKSRYFLRCGGRRMWGNAMIEAVAAGCLALGNPGEFKNRTLFQRETAVYSLTDALKTIRKFERDPEFRQATFRKQERLLEYFCYQRPMSDLVSRIAQMR